MLKDNRGVSTILGFVLAFAILIALLGLIQAVAVPQWVRGEEQDHFKLVTSEFSSLAKVIALSASTGSPNTVTLDLGVEHQDYPFLVTPPDMASSIFVKKLKMKVRYNETLPNGTVYRVNRDFITSAIILVPNYMYRGNVDFIYEHGYAYRKYEQANITMVDQNSFRNGSITLYILNTTFGNMSSTQPVNLNFAPVSQGGVIKVDNATITFESLNPSYWKDSLKNIGTVTVSGSNVTVKVKNVQLSMAHIVGSPESNVNAVTPSLDLIVPMISKLDLLLGETGKVEILARDQFGNPLAGVNITASVTGGIGTVRGVSGQSSFTSSNGLATFYFTATGSGTGKIDFTGVYKGVTKTTSLDVTVTDIRALNKWNSSYYNTSVIISPDFTWTGIYNASKIILKNATQITSKGEDKLDIYFVLYNKTRFYYFEVHASNKSEDSKVWIWENGVNLLNEQKLNSTLAKNIFNSVGVDILDPNSYSSCTGSCLINLSKLRNFLQNATASNPVDLAVQDIKGWKVEIQII